MNPWEHYSTTERHEEINPGCGHYSNTYRSAPSLRARIYDAHFTTVPDNKQLRWRKGDIIKFDTGFHGFYSHDWKQWFLKAKDKTKFLPVNKKIPKYARNEYAIILNRYKWIKYKGYSIYTDYGVIIMMLTGSKAGRVRRYYASSYPWTMVKEYPYKHCRKHIGVKLDIDYNLINTMKQINCAYEGEQARDLFLSCVYYIMNGSNSADPAIEAIAKMWLTR